MKTKKLFVFLLILSMIFVMSSKAQQINKGIIPAGENKKTIVKNPAHSNSTTNLYCQKGIGELIAGMQSLEDEYQVYFHVPIAYREQIPLLFSVEGQRVLDYRFIYLDSVNMIISADMEGSYNTNIYWNSYVLKKGNTYSDLPDFVSMDELENLPDSVTDFLKSTDCVQSSNLFIRNIADTVRNNTDNIMQLAENIRYVCDTIGYGMSHHPVSLDAFYTLNWGSSCTGHAHAGAALFRANGVPARVLLNVPSWFPNYMDHHWSIEYYVPHYGWVGMETSLAINAYDPKDQVITFACNSWDEFPVFIVKGLECQWHTSGEHYLGWGMGHKAEYMDALTDISIGQRDSAFSLTKSVNKYFTKLKGIRLNSEQQQYFDIAYQKQVEALDLFLALDYESFMAKMQEALDAYQNITIYPLQTLFFDDCENGNIGWSFEGENNKWEIGTPIVGPDSCWSGISCWGTDLSSNYANNASYSLISPSINLSGLSCAYLSFAIFSNIEDDISNLEDKITMDVVLNDSVAIPLCSRMGGVIDNEVIPQVGGWNRIVLDLTKFIGHNVKVKFNLISNDAVSYPGAYIDDIKVYGREYEFLAVTNNDNQQSGMFLGQNFPNPFRYLTKIEYLIDTPGKVELVLLDVNGLEVRTIVDECQSAGKHSVAFDAHDIPTGIYFYRLKKGGIQIFKKCVKVN